MEPKRNPMKADSPSRSTDRSGARHLSRRSFLATSSVTALAASFELPRPVRAAAAPSGTFADVRGGGSTFLGGGGTIGVLVGEGALAVIDSQFPDAAPDGVRRLRSEAHANQSESAVRVADESRHRL